MPSATTSPPGSRPELSFTWLTTFARVPPPTTTTSRTGGSYLIEQIDAYRREQTRESVSDFDPDAFDPDNSFARIGEGSLGGKARALAFVRHLLRDFGVVEQFQGMQITVPPCVVLATDVFDLFLEHNDLRQFAMRTDDDREIEERFVAAAFPAEIERTLAAYWIWSATRLAVRSSSLLEDSQYQPLAGVYETYMLPNNHTDDAVRSGPAGKAVKRVFASTFLTYAKNYFKVTPYRLEEEKMAVIIQKMVGSRHGDPLLSLFAGVARSHNFYPTRAPLCRRRRRRDGVGSGADRGRWRSGAFVLPRAPPAPHALLRGGGHAGQLAAGLHRGGDGGRRGRHRRAPLTRWRSPRPTAPWVGWLPRISPENDAVYDGISRPGVRLVSFAPILKQRSLPPPGGTRTARWSWAAGA